jgi:hypothetical protein
MQTHIDPIPTESIRFVVPPKLDHELEWFLEENQKPTRVLRLAPKPGSPPAPPDPQEIKERIASAVIGGWLHAMDAYDADVLRCAYAPPGPQPRPHQKRLGRLAPLVARFASAETGCPDAVDWRAMKRHTRTAREVLRAALRAYARERGNAPCMV